MEKVKEFVKAHQKEIVIGTALYLSYCIGYRRGWNKYNKIINQRNTINGGQDHGRYGENDRHATDSAL